MVAEMTFHQNPPGGDQETSETSWAHQIVDDCDLAALQAFDCA